MKESITVILLNGNNIKLLSKFVFLDPWISAILRPYQRHLFVHWMIVSIEIYNWSKSRESVSVDFLSTIET